MLVVIFEGHGDGPRADMQRARALLERAGGRYDGEDAARRWLSHRYAVSYRQAPVYASGAWVDTMEVAATWCNLGALYDGVRRALGRARVRDGAPQSRVPRRLLHLLLVRRQRAARRDAPGAATGTRRASRRTSRRGATALAAAEAAGGTIAHHHGVGRSKAPRLRSEVGAGIEVVRAVKRALDPRGIMNPGNLLPDASETPPEGPPPMVAPHERRRAAARMTLDAVSQLADVAADVPVAEIERWLAAEGLTLSVTGANVTDASIGAWLEGGAHGARDAWSDPADHLVAGFVARFHDGSEVTVRPAPRRSVGPDLLALVAGTKGRFARLSRVWIRVHALGGARVAGAPFRAERDAVVSAEEERLLARIADALA